jgi:hypothetical protein
MTSGTAWMIADGGAFSVHRCCIGQQY